MSLVLAIVAQASVLGSHAYAADHPSTWRTHLPDGWLVAVEVRDLQRLEAQAERLLAAWGRHSPSLRRAFAAFCPGVALAERPWGAALTETGAGGLSPLLFVPTDDYDRLCETLDADRAGSTAVASVAGYDVALVDRGGWVQASLLEASKNLGAETPPAPPAWAVDSNVALVLSPAGIERLAETLDRRRRGQLEAGRGRIGPWRWPDGLAGSVEALAPYAPLANALVELGSPLEIGFDLAADELRVVTSLGVGIDEQAVVTPHVSLAESEIARLDLSARLPAPLIDLAIAWMRCRPDDIDAPDYPQPQWDDLAAAYRTLFAGFQSATTTLTLPGEGRPVAANQATAFGWSGDADQLGDALQLVVLRWNQLIDAADARTPLRIQMAPLDGAIGWRLTTDLFEGFAIERSPEVEAVFHAYYGSDVLTVDVTRREDNRWLVSYGPAGASLLERVPPQAPATGPQGAGILAAGELRLDRWYAWKQLIEDVDMATAVGHRVRPPMAEAPPARLRVMTDDALRVEAVLPMSTYEAATAYWRAEKRAPTPR